MLVPVLDEIVLEGAKNGVEDVMIGMAHRGRLSVLAHVLEKPYSHMFAEFKTCKNRRRSSKLWLDWRRKIPFR